MAYDVVAAWMEGDHMEHWEQELQRYALAPGDLPGALGQLVAHVAPLAVVTPFDWPALMAVTLFSALWPNVDVDGRPLNLWFVGVGAGAALQAVGDELLATLPDVATTTTGGVEALTAAPLAYHAPADGLLRSIQEYPPRKQTLATLAAQRPPQPARVSLVLTTGIAELTSISTRADWATGWLGHCLICAPNTKRRLSERYPTAAERAAVTLALQERVAAYADVRHVTVGQSKRLAAYARLVGAESERDVPLDAPPPDEPEGVLLVERVRKVAALMALASEAPAGRGDTIQASEAAVDIAVRLVARSHAYGRRVADFLGKTQNDAVMDKVVSYFHQYGGEANPREIMTRRRLTGKEVHGALQLLAQEGRITPRQDGRKLIWVWKGSDD